MKSDEVVKVEEILSNFLLFLYILRYIYNCTFNISCDDWKNPGWGMLDNEKENGTSQRAIVSLEKRKKRAQVIFSVPAEDVHHVSFFLPKILF